MPPEPDPVATYNVYFLQPEWLQNRADVELFNSDTFSTALRRLTMTSAFLYNEKTNEKIGEYTSNYSQISSLVNPFVNVIHNDQVNLFDKLILPNVSTGLIYINGDSYQNLKFNFPPRTITQDINGRKVVIRRISSDQSGDAPQSIQGKIKFQILVYKEDL